ncbi:hypothetical protein [Jannaschia sp. CCS1]|uniref:hypothetical protein n=1 Tax=Jannaschia sp. (strain CCS1) TaxID=290400 RepID=UPI000053CE2F|nr:hypothetical protein [Jannaschia sp. CCS1]ABD55578.1 hypothetical protein Jann_2661 [Jannaschia sp. CCS1]
MRLPTFALSVLACLAAPLTAQEAFTWVYDAEFGFYPENSRLNLIATQDPALNVRSETGLPRGLIWATCLGEIDGGEIAIRFESFAGAAQNWDTVPFTLSGSSGATFNMTGEVRDAGPDPVGGVEILVLAGGLEMQMLATSDIVTYGVTGLDDFITAFDLSANRAYVGEFDAHCSGVAPGGALQRQPSSGSALAPLSGPVPDFGPAISGHDWARFTDIRDDVFQTILNVRYGVPQTDDVLIVGECNIGAQGPLVALQVSADVEGLVEHAPATLRIRSSDGRSVDVDGSVVGTEAELGILGIEVVLAPSDPAWQVIAGDEIVQFERVGGRDGFVLTGDGPGTLGPFLTDCDQIGDLTPEGGTSPGAPAGEQGGSVSCDALGQVVSADTGQPMVLTFRNQSGVFRGLSWIGADGVPLDQGGLNAGEVVSFNTDPGHIWMATDGPGNCREMIQPVSGQIDYILTEQ